MRSKQGIIAGLIAIIIIINIGFWYWTSQDDIDLAVAVGALKEWEKINVEAGINFDVPKNFTRELTGSAVYLFEPKSLETAMIFEKFNRQNELAALAQAKKVLGLEVECAKLSSVADFSVLRDCPYLDGTSSFAVKESAGDLFVFSFNQRWFSADEINFVINGFNIKK